jgi:hypothetical protein
MDFFHSLFIEGVGAGSYFSHTLWMIIVCLVLAYLVLLVSLQARMYDRPERVRELIDTEMRIKLCAAWSVFAVMLFVAGTAGWIYLRALLPAPAGGTWYLQPLAAHATVLVLLLLLWLGIHLSIRRDSKNAQALLP